MKWSFSSAVAGGVAASILFAAPAEAAILLTTFSGTTSSNSVRDANAAPGDAVELGSVAFSGTIRIDTERLPADAGGSAGFDYFADASPFLLTALSIGGEAIDLSGSLGLTNQLRGVAGSGGFVELFDGRTLAETVDADGRVTATRSAGLALFGAGDLATILAGGVSLPDFASLPELSFELTRNDQRFDYAAGSDFPSIAGEVRVASGTLTGVTTSVVASAVPEPATWATMILGVGLIGGALRRRARVHVAFA